MPLVATDLVAMNTVCLWLTRLNETKIAGFPPLVKMKFQDFQGFSSKLIKPIGKSLKMARILLFETLNQKSK